MTPLAQADVGTAVTDGLRSVATFVPKLIGFLVILLVGYFVAKAVATVLDKVLERAGFDRAVERGGIKKALAQSKYDASDIVSKLAFYAIFIPFLSAAVGVLGIQALQQPLAQFIALIPQIIVAVVLVVIGAVLAGTVKNLIVNTIGGLSYGRPLGTVAGALVLLLFVKAALDQVGVATQVTTPVLVTVLATVAGVIIVGAGGGLIKPMQHRWESYLTKAQQESQNIKQQAQQSPGAPQGYGQPQGYAPQGYAPQGYAQPGYAEPATQQMPAAPYPTEQTGGSYGAQPQDLSGRDPYGR